MSGGSFNYLFTRDAGSLFDHSDDLARMIEQLDALGFLAEAPADRSRKLLALVDYIDSEIQALAEVWRAVEWWQSNDWSRDQVLLAIGAYRAWQQPRPEGPDGPPA